LSNPVLKTYTKKFLISYTNRYICGVKFIPRSEKTRQFIIETTAALFNKKGYAGTSMSDITTATKLTKGSIYGNFENKEEVALAVFEYNAGKRNKIINERIQKAVTNKDKLMVYATIYGSTGASVFAEGGCPLLNTGTEADDTHEPLRKKVSAELIQWQKEIVMIINNGIVSKEFRKDTDPQKMAFTIVAIIEGGIFIARTTKTLSNLDQTMDTIKEIIQSISLKKK